MVRQPGDIPSWGVLSWAVRQLEFLDQVLGCSVGMAQLMGLHRGYTGCCRHRLQAQGQLWGQLESVVPRVMGIVGVMGEGCGSCAGMTGAGSGTEMQGLAGAYSVAAVTSEVVSVGLTLPS